MGTALSTAYDLTTPSAPRNCTLPANPTWAAPTMCCGEISVTENRGVPSIHPMPERSMPAATNAEDVLGTGAVG